MIIDITNEVYSNLKIQLSPTTVLQNFPSTTPVFPCVVIEELVNTSHLDSRDTGGEKYNNVTFEINIFSNTQNKITQVKSIRNQIDVIMADSYGMTRTFSNPVPNFADTNIYRYTLRYTFTIDADKVIHKG